MYLVFFLIDRVNPAMNFIDNGLTKGLLAVFAAASAFVAWPAALRRASRRPSSAPAQPSGTTPPRRRGTAPAHADRRNPPATAARRM